ncbi:MAG: hypothetical protein ACK5TO_07090 [Planctomycetaceae bacterium]
MSLKTIRSVALATLGAVVLSVVGCAPAPSAPPASGSASTLPTNGPPSTDPTGAAKPAAAAADDQAGSTTGATESSEK